MSRKSQLDVKKKRLDIAIDRHNQDKITISQITAGTFVISFDIYPIALLDSAVSKLREKNITIRWEIDVENMYQDQYINRDNLHKSIMRLYKDPFWQLIGNHDVLIFNSYQDNLESCFEQLLDLLKHVNVLEFRFKGLITDRNSLEELLDIIYTRFNSKILIYDFKLGICCEYIDKS